jgi:hypothetical protein
MYLTLSEIDQLEKAAADKDRQAFSSAQADGEDGGSKPAFTMFKPPGAVNKDVKTDWSKLEATGRRLG